MWCYCRSSGNSIGRSDFESVTVRGGGVRGTGSRHNQGEVVKGGFNEGGRQARKHSPGRGQTHRAAGADPNHIKHIPNDTLK